MTICAVLAATGLAVAPSAVAVPAVPAPASVDPSPSPLEPARPGGADASAPPAPTFDAAAPAAPPTGSVDLAREGFPWAPSIARIDGADRWEAAANISESHFDPGVPVAYVASGKVFPDALAAGPVAALGGGPILLTNTTSLPAATQAELKRLQPGRIVVLGGRNTVDASVQGALGAFTGGLVSRIGGADRYEAAANISESFFDPGVPVAYVASGKVFPDALAAGPVAALGNAPILLTNTASLPEATNAELERLQPGRIVVLGGPNSVARSVETALAGYTSGGVSRIGGADRWEAAANISESFFDPGVPVAYVASGKVFPDALAAGPVAAAGDGPILLTNTGTLPAATQAELERLQPERIVVLGGLNTVRWWVQTELSPYVTARPVSEYLPLPDDADTGGLSGTDVAAVSCPDTGRCVAVGTYAVAGGGHAPLLLEQDGTTWTARVALLPDDAAPATQQPSQLLLDVSCEGVGECVAVGRYENAAGDAHDLVLTMASSAWSVTPVDIPGARAWGDRFWSEVSCEGGECAAAGAHGTPAQPTMPFLGHRGDGDWSAQLSGYSSAEYLALECSAATCAATGQRDRELPLVARWNGTSWRETSLYPWSYWSRGLDVACAAADDCLAVGEQENDDLGMSPLLSTWNGSKWALRDMTWPTWAADVGTEVAPLQQVECPMPDLCAAVGFLVVPDAYTVPMVTIRTATGWGTVDLPTPPGYDGRNPQHTMTDLWCSAAADCVADSVLPFTDGTRHRVVLVNDGRWWQPFVVDAPNGSSLTKESDLDCSEAGVCVGVGTDSASRPVLLR